jgi:hypothetical protein
VIPTWADAAARVATGAGPQVNTRVPEDLAAQLARLANSYVLGKREVPRKDVYTFKSKAAKGDRGVASSLQLLQGKASKRGDIPSR